MTTTHVVVPTGELVKQLLPWDHLFAYCGGVREFVATHVKCSAEWEDVTHRRDVADEIFFKAYMDYNCQKTARHISERETAGWWQTVMKLNMEISDEVERLVRPIFSGLYYDAGYQHQWRMNDLVIKVDYWYA